MTTSIISNGEQQLRLNFPENTVIYDDGCPACTLLANFLGRRSSPGLSYRPYTEVRRDHPTWAAFAGERPSALYFWADGVLVSGTAAWESLLKRDPSLRQLHWLAVRANLVPQAARILERAGTTLRRLCRSCPRPDLR